jgi:branched-chain amino acid transport system substrate-binding protein
MLGLALAGARQIIGWPRDANEAADLARAAARGAPRSRLYLGPGAATDAFLTLAGAAGDGVRTVGIRLLVADQLWEGDPATTPVREFVQAFRLRFGTPPPPAGALSCDAGRVLARALERSGPDRERLRDAVESTWRFGGATGWITFTADHVGLDRDSFVIVRAERGVWRLPA